MRNSRAKWCALLLCAALAGFYGTVLAAEHPEHPTEHPTSEAQPKPLTVEQLADAITSYINNDAQLKGGYFLVYDPVVKKPLALTLDHVHKDKLASLGGGVYFACADFKSTEGTLYDVDVFMKGDGNALNTTEVHIHKVEGKPRYTWSEENGVWVRKDVQ